MLKTFLKEITVLYFTHSYQSAVIVELFYDRFPITCSMECF